MGGPATDRPFLLSLQAYLPTLHADCLCAWAEAVVLANASSADETSSLSDASRHRTAPRRRRGGLMRRAIAISRRLLVCPRGTVLVGYTSLMLLVAVAAIIMLGHVGSRADHAHDAKTTAAN
jgi:hypothetical protein